MLLALLAVVEGIVRVGLESWVYADTRATPSVVWRKALYHQNPGPDVLIMGSSRVQLGLSPTLMAQAAAPTLGYTPRLLNVGMKLGTTQSNLWYLKNVVLPSGPPPKVIIYGAAEYEFNAHINLPHVYDYTDELANLDDYRQAFPDPGQRIDAQLGFLAGRVSDLVRYHQTIRDKWEAADAPPPADIPGLQYDPYGFVPSTIIMDNGTIARMRGQYVDAPGWGLLRDYQVGSPATDRFEDFLNLAQAHGIRVIVINMPVARAHLSFLSRDAYVQYQTYLRDTAARHGLPFYDYTAGHQGLFVDPHDWQDTNHLNIWGAQKLSPLVMREAVLPVLQQLGGK
jgi:hypothetical protein